MTKPVEKITINGRGYSKFIRWPKAVRDGTVRCMACGQIDELEYHDHDLCVETRRKAFEISRSPKEEFESKFKKENDNDKTS